MGHESATQETVREARLVLLHLLTEGIGKRLG